MLSFQTRTSVNLNTFFVRIPLMQQWEAVIVKNINSKRYLYYLYSNVYFFRIVTLGDYFKPKFDLFSRTLSFCFKYVNNFFALYWGSLIRIFTSFNKQFFRKLKFRGKGFYIYKNKRNTVAMQFGFSHRVRVYSYFLFVKFLSKTSVFLYGLHTPNLTTHAYKIQRIRPISIFTGKGIRFTRQIIYKKTGKVGAYR